MARIKHGTLTADTVATVELDDNDYSSVEILNVSGDSAIYIRIDGTAPTVAGDDCDVIPAVVGGIVLDAADSISVKLISAGTPQYSVKGW